MKLTPLLQQQKNKVKLTLLLAIKFQRGLEVELLSSSSPPNRSGWWTTCPGRFTPGKETRYPLYRRVDGPQDRARKMSPPPGFDRVTPHPVASRYSDWAIPDHLPGPAEVNVSSNISTPYTSSECGIPLNTRPILMGLQHSVFLSRIPLSSTPSTRNTSLSIHRRQRTPDTS